MTRRSKRDLEAEIDHLTANADTVSMSDRSMIVYEDAETGEWYDNPDLDGDPVEPAEGDDGPLMIILKAEYIDDPEE